MKYKWYQSGSNKSRWEKIQLVRKLISSAEEMFELDHLEPIDDVTEAKAYIDKLRKKDDDL